MGASLIIDLTPDLRGFVHHFVTPSGYDHKLSARPIGHALMDPGGHDDLFICAQKRQARHSRAWHVGESVHFAQRFAKPCD